MNILSGLGALAGAFLLVPKGIVALAVIWTIGKFSPVIGWTLFAAFVLFGGER